MKSAATGLVRWAGVERPLMRPSSYIVMAWILLVSGCMPTTHQTATSTDNNRVPSGWLCEAHVNDGKNGWQCQVATIGHVMLNDADSEKVDALSIDAGETDVESALGGILSSIEDLSASSAMSSVETWTAQLGAFSTRAVAEGVRDDFARRDIVVWLYPAENEYAAFTQVLFGRYVSRASAMAAVEELRKQHPELEYWLRRVPLAD
ncbi:MAG TPA: hypothetical protein DD440_06175 [Porticoccaceae bacterium]|nr:hypothetical protein [Porticoccaceae bacterium]